MNELTKTLLAVVVCAGLVVGAFVATRETNQVSAQDQVDKMLVDVPDPLAVAAMKIVNFDSTTGQRQEFEVAKRKSEYTIASRFNYPADAKVHLRRAANSVNRVKIVSVAGQGNLAIEEFGVIDPDSPELKKGSKGAGMRVTLEDDKKKTLADFIIGPEVEGSKISGPANKPDPHEMHGNKSKKDPLAAPEYEDEKEDQEEAAKLKSKDQTQLRYARKADKDQVYQVEIDTQYLSTQFEDWIKKDLLQIEPIDVKRVAMADYTPAMGPDGVVRNDRSFVEVSYDGQGLKWNLDQWLTFENRRPHPQKLGADQELNQAKLDELKSALDDLKIANVEPKPHGLQGQAEKILRDPKLLGSLVEKGFYPVAVTTDPQTGENQLELIGDQGDVVARLSNGVEYTLRFGREAGRDTKDAKAEKEKKEQKPADPLGPKEPAPAAAPAKLLRYLNVMARFDESLIPKPELEPLPELEPAKPAEPAKKEDPKADPGKTDAKKEPEKKNAEKAAPAKDAAAPKKDDVKKDEAAKKDEAKKEDDVKKDDAKKDEAKKDDAAKEPEKKKEPPKPTPEELKAKREAVAKANDLKQKAYNDKVVAGKKKVAELNKRFGAWYYVISDETYQKLHLADKDVFQKKPPKDAKAPGEGGPQGLPSGLDPGSLLPPTK